MKPEGEIIYEYTAIKGEPTDAQRAEDTPSKYVVRKNDRVASGIIVDGFYHNSWGDRWVVNPPCRELIAHLLRRLKELCDDQGGALTAPPSLRNLTY